MRCTDVIHLTLMTCSRNAPEHLGIWWPYTAATTIFKKFFCSFELEWAEFPTGNDWMVDSHPGAASSAFRRCMFFPHTQTLLLLLHRFFSSIWCGGGRRMSKPSHGATADRRPYTAQGLCCIGRAAEFDAKCRRVQQQAQFVFNLCNYGLNNHFTHQHPLITYIESERVSHLLSIGFRGGGILLWLCVCPGSTP